MRGEHPLINSEASAGIGSPPHARGTLTADSKNYFFARITPACAGNTKRKEVKSWEIRDHPRMRGEHPSL